MRIFSHLMIILAVAFTTSAATAGVSKVSSPRVTKGKMEVEYSATRYGDDSKDFNNKQSHAYEFEYAFSDDFKMGIEAKSMLQSGSKGHEFEGYGVEAQYEMTSQGPWWLTSAIKAEYLHTPRSATADEVELKLLVARRYGASSLVINLGLEREFGGSHAENTKLDNAVQGKHVFNEYFAPGFEWHGGYGAISELGSNSEHYLGPIVSGKLFEVNGTELGYTAGYFWGLTSNSADNAARIQLGLEF